MRCFTECELEDGDKILICIDNINTVRKYMTVGPYEMLELKMGYNTIFIRGKYDKFLEFLRNNGANK